MVSYGALEHLRWLLDRVAFRLLHGQLHAEGAAVRSASLSWREFDPLELHIHAAARSARYVSLMHRVTRCLPPALATDRFVGLLVAHQMGALPFMLEQIGVKGSLPLRDAARVVRLQDVCERSLRREGVIPQKDLDTRDRALALIDPQTVELPAVGGLDDGRPVAFCATSLAAPVPSYVVGASAAGRPVLGRGVARNTGEDFSLYVRLDSG